MSKGIYVGVDNVARKVKKAFVGVDDVARKVKKGYIGVGGVARPFFSSESGIAYYGKGWWDDIFDAYAYLSIDGVGYLGGDLGVCDVNKFEQDSSGNIVRSQFDAPSTWSTGLDALAPTGEYIVVASFARYDDFIDVEKLLPPGNPFEAINTSGEIVDTAAVLYDVYGRTGGSNGKHAIFYGGQSANYHLCDFIEAFDKTLTLSSLSIVNGISSGYAKFAKNGNHALFFGGSSGVSPVVAIDQALTQTELAPMTITSSSMPTRSEVGATTVDGITLVAGGSESVQYPYYWDEEVAISTVVDIYDSNLTKLTPTNLEQARRDPAATTLGEFAMFASGYFDKVNSKENRYKSIEIFDKSLVRKYAPDLKESVGYWGITAGNFAIFGSGYQDEDDYYHGANDVYTVL